MLLRPQGLFGIHEIWDFWPKKSKERSSEQGGNQMSDSSLPAPDSLLDVDDIGISFGGLKAVQHFSIRIPRGALYGLIGPNGAGKTTVFNLLTGVYQTMGGRMSLDASNLVGLEAARSGGGRNRSHVSEHPLVSGTERARQRAARRPVAGAARTGAHLIRSKRYLAEEAEIRRKAFELLGLFGLQDRADEPADSLSYGHQRIWKSFGHWPRGRRCCCSMSRRPG